MTASAAQAASVIHVTTTVQSINDDAECSLQEAIYAANLDASKAPDPANLGDRNAFITTGCAAGTGDDTIVLPAMATFTMSGPVADVLNYVGSTATPLVTSNIVIEAAGAKIVHGGGPVPYRAFAVGRAGGGTGVAGDLTLHEIHVKGFEVQGGDGGGGGGGGLGAGGAVYVSEGALSVGWSTFEQNGALGGDGSSGNTVGAGGGGGGLGGDGGRPSSRAFAAGGGGGGARGDGGSAFDPEGFATLAAGGGGTLTAGSEFGDGGFACGGDGGNAGTIGGSNGEDAGCPGGGGGGGDSESGITVPSGDGGDGSYGGGGGGGGYSAGDGGRGGFGGGGGAGPGGVLFGDPGDGGAFAGDAGDTAGGGGAGLGGAIFGDRATITVRNSTFFNNYANRGHSGGTGANDGRGAGGAIFVVAGPLFVNSSTFNNNQTGEFTAGIGGLGGGGIVVFKPDGEAASLTLRNSILAGNGPHECYARNGASVSGIGNLITDNSQNNRGDAICGGVVTSADPQLEALALNPPGRTPTMKIPATSPAVDAAHAATSEPDDQRGVARPQGAGFDIGAYEAGDSSPPVTTITLTPNAPNGSNGWYKTSVGVSVTAVDDTDPAPSTRCGLNLSNSPTSFDDLPDAACPPFNVVVDSSLHTVYAASRDASGNTETPLVTRTFKVDRTAPTLNPALSAPPVLGQTGVTALPNATDATSGVASASCGAVDTSTPGPKTVTCTATDNAGNTASAVLSYVVEYKILGFFSPVPGSRWKVGQTVPVKVALGDASGARISDSAAQALATACRVKFSASGAQTKSPQCMRYDAREDQFVYVWMLARSGTGPATIKVSVSYPGTTFTTQATLQITITR